MQKRGSSHVEVIISFIIFISALVSIVYLFLPRTEPALLDSSLSYSYSQIIKQTEVELKQYVYEIKKSPKNFFDETFVYDPDEPPKPKNETVKINLPADFNPESIAYRIRVEDSQTGNVYPSQISGNSVYIQTGDDFTTPLIIEVYLSSELPVSGFNHIPDLTQDLTVSSGTYYELKASSEEMLPAASKLKTLASSNLKERLNLAGSTEVVFSFDSEGIVASKTPSSSLNVYSKSQRIKYLDESGTRPYGELGVKVW
jgi:hypothetical protein